MLVELLPINSMNDNISIYRIFNKKFDNYLNEQQKSKSLPDTVYH